MATPKVKSGVHGRKRRRCAPQNEPRNETAPLRSGKVHRLDGLVARRAEQIMTCEGHMTADTVVAVVNGQRLVIELTRAGDVNAMQVTAIDGNVAVQPLGATEFLVRTERR